MIEMSFGMHRGFPFANTPSARFIGNVLTGLEPSGVKVALEDIEKVRSGVEREAEYGHNGYSYEITTTEAHLFVAFDERIDGTISLDLWEECVRRYHAWLSTPREA
jgi:hypothetical protein